MALNVTGVKELQAKLIVAGKKCTNEAAAALYIEGELIKTASMKRCPVDTGVLRASHEVDKPVVEGDSISVTIGVGGPAVGYAVYVHENPMAHHPVGEYKFLQKSVEEATPGLAGRIAKRIAAMVK
jgi:hypothetical protein